VFLLSVSTCARFVIGLRAVKLAHK
jgi:hypothetical protein